MKNYLKRISKRIRWDLERPEETIRYRTSLKKTTTYIQMNDNFHRLRHRDQMRKPTRGMKVTEKSAKHRTESISPPWNKTAARVARTLFYRKPGVPLTPRQNEREQTRERKNGGRRTNTGSVDSTMKEDDEITCESTDESATRVTSDGTELMTLKQFDMLQWLTKVFGYFVIEDFCVCVARVM